MLGANSTRVLKEKDSREAEVHFETSQQSVTHEVQCQGHLSGTMDYLIRRAKKLPSATTENGSAKLSLLYEWIF